MLGIVLINKNGETKMGRLQQWINSWKRGTLKTTESTFILETITNFESRQSWTDQDPIILDYLTTQKLNYN